MSERKIIWQSSVKGIVNGIWVYTLAGIAGSVVSSIGDLTSGVDIMKMIEQLMNGDMFDAGPSYYDIAGWICTIAVVAGYFMFYSSVKRLAGVQANDSDRDSIDSIRSSYIMLLVASLAGLVPIIGGLVAFILLMVAYSKQLKAYKAISCSQAYSAQAKQGALLLRKCTQWILASVFIGWLPVVGGFAESLILLITFFKILQGWKMIGENECVDTESCEATVTATAMTEKNYEYADAAAVKSDDELKAIINDGAAYDAAFVDIARNELMERTLGNRVQRTAEEVAAAKAERERLRLEHEARLQAAREERERQLQAEREEQRRQKEEQEERERQEREELRRYRKNFLKKLAPWAAGLLLLVVTVYIIVWNNTTSRYLDRGLDAARKGNVEKALKFVAKAEKKGLDETTVTWEALYRIYDCADMTEKYKYMELLADAGVTRYALFWGLHLADTGKSSKYYLPYLEVGKGAFNENCDQERAKALYLIGNDMYSKGDTYNANQQWARSSPGCNQAKVRMGDYILCHNSELLASYEAALSYYNKAGLPDMPGVKEKIAVLEQIVKSDPTSWQERKGYGWFEADRTHGKTVWGCMEFGNGHMYAKFVNGAGGTVTGLPHTDCIYCEKNDNSAYLIYAGGLSCDKGGYYLNGDGVLTWRDGLTAVGRWHQGTRAKDCKLYPAEHFW